MMEQGMPTVVAPAFGGCARVIMIADHTEAALMLARGHRFPRATMSGNAFGQLSIDSVGDKPAAEQPGAHFWLGAEGER